MLRARLAAVNQATPEDYRRMDTLFHLSIAELTGSSLLAAACADARMRLNDLLNAIPVLQRNIDHTAAQHTAIVTAILAGDTRCRAARDRRAPGRHRARCCGVSSSERARPSRLVAGWPGQVAALELAVRHRPAFASGALHHPVPGLRHGPALHGPQH